MKYYTTIALFAFQAMFLQLHAINTGTDPVGHAEIRAEAEEDREEGREKHL